LIPSKKSNVDQLQLKLFQKLTNNESDLLDSVPDGQASLVSLLDILDDPNNEQIVSPIAGTLVDKSLFSIEQQPLIFDQRACTVITLRDITQLRKVSELTARNKFISLMSSSFNHEMAAPLRCMIHISDQMRKKLPA
jgi:hypothetical protein